MLHYRRAARRLFLLDYDGTLVGLQPRLELSKPSAHVYAVLERLCADSRNTVVIVSGRAAHWLDEWLGHLPLTLVAEHGWFMKEPHGTWLPAAEISNEWKRAVLPGMQAAVKAAPGSFIEEKATSLVWHYRRADSDPAERQATTLLRDLGQLERPHGLKVERGRKIVEARLNGPSKGVAAKNLLARADWDFVCAAGDDTTDEEMFAALPPTVHTFKIGSGPTAARNRCASPAEFVTLLEQCVIVSV
jgi:trehalose 6-phosphate synthase/phosphatase